jgi:hypothetical protein
MIAKTSRRTGINVRTRPWGALCLLACSAMLLFADPPSPHPRILRSIVPETKRDAQLELAIRSEIGSDRFSYAYNPVSLHDGSASEALVYMRAPDYCGSGGCTALIFTKHNGDYRLITRLSLTRPPIVVSSHRTNGWKDLIIFVAGGGIRTGYYAVLSFDGKKYPENPTTAPATPLRATVTGIAFFTETDTARSDIIVSPR